VLQLASCDYSSADHWVPLQVEVAFQNSFYFLSNKRMKQLNHIDINRGKRLPLFQTQQPLPKHLLSA